MTDSSFAARWQERKRHWIKLGFHPSLAGYFAWWYEPAAGYVLDPDDWDQSPESLREAHRPVSRNSSTNWNALPTV